MRAYKFLEEHFGLKSLTERRLKISRLTDLNDPFELLPFDLRDRRKRLACTRTKETLAQNRGILCFGGTWHDPVLWAHYSAKHTGICIGFEIPDDAQVAKRVSYVSKPLPFPSALTLSDAWVAERMLFTKYSNWQYEKEIRMYAALNEQDGGLYFREFDEVLRPVLIIVGMRCELARGQVTTALGELRQSVKLIKARAAFGKFEIVENKRGFE